MYIDLRTKLAMYKSSQQNKEKETIKKGPDIHELLSGEIVSNESGSFYLVEKSYPPEFIHGGYSLVNALNQDYTLSSKMTGEKSTLDINKMIFLDTETTGLSGGTGTIAFLLGIGYFNGNSFTLKQFFMRDYNEEAAALKALNNILMGFEIVVTYNGKSFDWNLLQSRYTSNRMRIGIKRPVHLDLLYPSRVMWRNRLESCRLSSIEENILKLKRIDDIPGSLIPTIYFKYLEDRNATEIKKAVIHNEKDILSMVSLLIKLNTLITAPLEEARDAAELYGVGRMLEKWQLTDSAISCFTKCTSSVNLNIKELSLKRLALIYKRNKNYIKAAQCLEDVLNISGTPNIPVKIELAKHYEHRLPDYEKAYKIVSDALNQCTQISLIKELYYEELKTRHERLKRKIKKKNKNYV